jgi:hypothetical protein
MLGYSHVLGILFWECHQFFGFTRLHVKHQKKFLKCIWNTFIIPPAQEREKGLAKPNFPKI